MPIYDLKCTRCFVKWEHVDTGSLEEPVCPMCGRSEYKRLITPVNFKVTEYMIKPWDIRTDEDLEDTLDYEEEDRKNGYTEEWEYIYGGKSHEEMEYIAHEIKKKHHPEMLEPVKPEDFKFPELPTREGK